MTKELEDVRAAAAELERALNAVPIGSLINVEVRKPEISINTFQRLASEHVTQIGLFQITVTHRLYP